jgi:hypothetical protein
MTDTSPTPAPASDLRALLDAVRTALTLPADTPDHDRRMLDRAALVRAVVDGLLAEDLPDIAWDTGYLQRKVALEEQAAAAERGGEG